MHNFWIDEYAHLTSPLHRWEPRAKLIALMGLIFAFSLVQDLRLVPLMLAVTAGLYWLSGLPVRFLVSRLRYPGYFLLILAIILPLFSGSTVLLAVGPLAVRQEGVLAVLLVAARFGCILTVGLVLFGTAPFLTTIRAMRALGLPPLLADMTLLAFRYLFDMSDMLGNMETAMRLRGFNARRLSRRGLRTFAALGGTLLIRAFEQSERVYQAMRLRGYSYNGKSGEDAGRDVQLNAPTKDDLTAETPLLTVANLHFSYPDRPDVLRGVDFTLRAGERVGLIGPNGAGKTSLFLLLCGVLRPDSGAVTLNGQTVQPGAFHPEIGLVFQQSDDQLFSPSVEDDVAFGPLNMGLSADEVAARVREALATVGVTALAERPPHHLSGGEKRMVAIAGVLAMGPELIIYDEPDANLDVRARRRLIRFLQAPSSTHSGTFLLASHDLELVLEVCDRVILLDSGRIVADGEPRAILGDAALMAAHGLEKPHSLIPHEHAP